MRLHGLFEITSFAVTWFLKPTTLYCVGDFFARFISQFTIFIGHISVDVSSSQSTFTASLNALNKPRELLLAS